MNVGKSLKMALIKRDMTQTELAEKVGLTRQWIGVLANREKSSMDTVYMLAGAFNMDPADFLAMGEDSK